MDIRFLAKTAVFHGLTEDELNTALKYLKAEEKNYSKDEIIFHAGDNTDRMGLVLDGSVRIENNDFWGNRTLLGHVSAGQVFAETYALLKDEPLLVDAVANQDCSVLMFSLSGLLVTDRSSVTDPDSSWRVRLLSNLLTVFAHKNLMLSGRNFHTSPKSIRGRVMAYLNSVSLQEGSDEFNIPFDRQQLADYLNLDRTALSKELGKMQKDGIIAVRKNHFRIIT